MNTVSILLTVVVAVGFAAAIVFTVKGKKKRCSGCYRHCAGCRQNTPFDK